MTNKTIDISGMCCENCVTHVKSALDNIPQIENANVQLDTPQASIELKENISNDALIEAINTAGHYKTERVS